MNLEFWIKYFDGDKQLSPANRKRIASGLEDTLKDKLYVTMPKPVKTGVYLQNDDLFFVFCERGIQSAYKFSDPFPQDFNQFKEPWTLIDIEVLIR